MKLLKVLAAVSVLFCVLTLTVAAESGVGDFYAEQYEKSGAGDISEGLPDEARNYLSENGIDPSDYGWVNKLSAGGVFGHIWGFLKSGASGPLKAGAEITAIILITAALASADFKGSAASAAIYVAAASAAGIIAKPVLTTVAASVDALKGTGTFMLSFIPVFAVITAASGAPVTSASMSALLLAAAQGVSYISNFIVTPLMGGYLAVSISGAVSPLLKKTEIASIIKRLSCFIMAFVSTVFVGILGIQTAVRRRFVRGSRYGYGIYGTFKIVRRYLRCRSLCRSYPAACGRAAYMACGAYRNLGGSGAFFSVGNFGNIKGG